MERVVFVVNAEEFGGLEIVLLDWLSGIEYSKTSVVLCYRADVVREKLAARKILVEGIQLTFPIGKPFWHTFRSWQRLFASIKPHKIVLLEGNIGDLSLAPILAARLSVCNGVFLFAGGTGSFAPGAFSTAPRRLHLGFLPGIAVHRHKEILRQRFRARLLRRVFVSSQGVRESVLAFLGYPAGRTSVLLHGVDTQRFRPSPAERLEYRRAQGVPDDATVIVSHGRMARVKRVDRILKAFEVLSAEHADLWLLLTCYGLLKEEVEQMVANSHTCRRVKLVGFQEDASTILKASDFYVLASDREGFGIALIEAMSTGLVCVATNCQGPAGIIVNDENGILVEATDENVLAGLRRALSLSPEKRARLVQRARKTVENHFEIHTAIRTALDSMGIPTR